MNKPIVLKTSDILVPMNRQRTELNQEALLELTKSITNHGLINPIYVVKLKEPEKGKNYQLVAGERRYQASMLSGLGEIACVVGEGLSPIEIEIIEFEENVVRVPLEWTDRVAAIARIHERKQKEEGAAMQGDSSDGGWGLKETAAFTGQGLSTVSGDIKLAKALAERPELKKTLGKMSKSVAIRMISDMEKTEEAKVLRKTLTTESNIYQGDCIALIKALIKSETVDLVLTDPPFGVAQIEELRSSTDSTVYTKRMTDSDNLTEKAVSALLEELMPELYRVVKPGGYVFMFFQFAMYKRIVNLMKRAGFTVDDTPVIWDKGRPVSQFKGYRFQSSYEPILCARKETGKRRLESPGRNILSFAPLHSSKKIHAFEKPVDLLQKLIEIGCPRKGLVLDPFAGSGSTLEAAARSIRSAIGFDMDADHTAKAEVRLERVRTMLEDKKNEKREVV